MTVDHAMHLKCAGAMLAKKARCLGKKGPRRFGRRGCMRWRSNADDAKRGLKSMNRIVCDPVEKCNRQTCSRRE